MATESSSWLARAVEPGDVVATVDDLWRVDVVLVTPPGAHCVPVLAQSVKACCQHHA